MRKVPKIPDCFRFGLASPYACIAYAAPDDPYLARASVDFHTALGFHQVGLFTDCVDKFSP